MFHTNRVVVNSPAFDQDSCFEQRVKRFSIEQLISKFSVEEFDESVLPGTAWFDEQSFDADVLQPVTYSAGCKFRAVIWQADPQPEHPSEGTKEITFNNLPRLKPDTTYFVLADAGWIRLGGKPAHQLNDGAFWYRFRTGKQ